MKAILIEQKAIEVESNIELPRLSLEDISHVYNANENELPSHSA